MRKTFLLVFLLIIGISINANAQLSGTISIPGGYPTIADAIADLNLMGVGAGGVTFNVTPGHTETFASPLAGLITASGTELNPIIFQKSAAGTNPLITSGLGTIATSTTLGANGDGIIIIEGGDYITFNGIDLQENPVAVGVEKMEFGYFLKKASSDDACKNVTIRNCTITLDKASRYSWGIFVSNYVGTTSVTVTSVGGRSENIKIFNNNISNVYGGIQLRGYAAATPFDFYDQNIEVGVDGANTITNFGGGASTAYGFYAIYQNNLKIANNTINGGAGTTTTLYGISTSTGTNSNVDIYNNTVTIEGGGTTSTIYALNNAMGTSGTDNTVNIYNNTFENSTYPTATSGAMYMLYQSTSPFNVNIYGNVIRNNVKGGTSGSMYPLYNINTGTNGFANIYDNLIYGNEHSGTGLIYCLYSNEVSTSTKMVYDNTIYNNSGGGDVIGIFSATGVLAHIYGNNIYDLTSTTTGTASPYSTGIQVSTGTDVYVYNNYISDLKAPNSAAVDAVRGIGLTSASTNATRGVYYNTIFLNATSIGANFGSSGIYHINSTTPTSSTLDMRNNNIVNHSTPNGTGNTVAFRRSASNVNLNNYSDESNTNNFHAGTPGPNNLIFFDGTNSDQTLQEFKDRVTPRELASVSGNAPFVNSSIAPYDLRINTAVPTQLESSGTPVTTPIAINVDYDDNARYPNLGYPFNPSFPPSAPDIGADEFGGIPLDLNPPTIAFTPLGNTSSLSARTLTATITDLSGVPTAGIGLPVLYWSINNIAGPFTAATGSYIAGDDYQFSFGAGAVVDDIVYYYVVAQDEATSPNVGSSPGGGSGYTPNPPSAATPPPAPESYMVVGLPLSGVYTVGLSLFNQRHGKNIYVERVVSQRLKNNLGEDSDIDIAGMHEYDKDGNLISSPSVPTEQIVDVVTNVLMEDGRPFDPNFFLTENFRGVYPTITAAVNDITLRGVSGAVTFELVDSHYGSETYPILIGDIAGASEVNTITIKPANGVDAVIPGDPTQPTSTIQLGGAKYVTFDGSNSGGTTRDLRISALISTPAFQFFGGANHNVLKNTILDSKTTSTGSGVLLFGASASGDSNLVENVAIMNNDTSATRHAVSVYWFSSNTSTYNRVLNSQMIDFNSYAFRPQGAPSSNNIISGNEMYHTAPSSGTVYAVYISRQPGLIVENNMITNLQSSAGSPTVTGIYYIGSSGNDMNVIIRNNVVSISVDANIPAGTIRGIDYFGFAANSVEMYYNTVVLGGIDVTGGLSNGITKRDACVVYKSYNNAVYNSRSNGVGTGKHHAIFVSNTTSTTWEMDHNDYFANGTGGFLGSYNGADQSTIADWITASSKDLNSLGVNPMLVDNKPAVGSPLIGAGTPIAGITTDILGVTRSATTPTIGAYEVPPNVGISSIVNPVTGQIVNANGSDVTAYVMNFGNVDVTNVDVYYDLNGGTPVGPVVVAGPINPGDSAMVTFTGANQLTSMSDMTGTVNVYTDYADDSDSGNDTLSVANVFLRVPPSSFPYFSDFSESPTPYTISGSASLWGLFLTTNPSGTTSDPAARAFFWSVSSGFQILRSTMIDLTGTTNPLLSFYRAYTTYLSGLANDQLEVVVSTDGGITWSAPLYQRGWFSVPSLGTLPAQDPSYAPTAASQWMHNLVDLSAYAGQEIVVGFNAISAFGNNLWLDNIKVSDPDNISLIPVNAPGTYGNIITNGIQINFTALRPGLGNGSITQTDNQKLWTPQDVVFGHLSEATEERQQQVKDASMLSRNTSPVSTDASEGVLALSTFDDFPVSNTYAPNASATTFSGAIFTPDVVADRYWEVAFSGDDHVSTATYDVILDISTQLGIVDPDRLYIMKRVDQNSPWVCHSTITEYELGVAVRLIATGLTGFSQFGIGAEDGTLPVDLVEFNATVDRNNVTLNWTTAWEENNMRFDIQRRIAETDATWATVGSVTGSGTTQEQKSYSFLDRNLVTGKYEYKLVQVDFDGNSTADHTLSSQVEVGVPTEFAISQNYPNPFNPTTKIDFQIPLEGMVRLSIFDMSGREVATLVNEALTAGYYTYDFNASNFASGVYFYRIMSNNFVMTKRMVLVK